MFACVKEACNDPKHTALLSHIFPVVWWDEKGFRILISEAIEAREKEMEGS